MVLELSPEHNENFHVLEQTQDPERTQRFQEEQWLDQSSKFRSYNFLAIIDLKFKFNLRIIQSEHPGLWYVEERIAHPRSRTQSHKFRITYGTSNCKRRWTLFYRGLRLASTYFSRKEQAEVRVLREFQKFLRVFFVQFEDTLVGIW